MHRLIKLLPRFVRVGVFALIESEFERVHAEDVERLKQELLSRVAGVLEL